MSICDSIKKRYIRLSKGQRKVAQFVIDNPNVIVSHVASEVGRLAGVSESTVIRFCYAMDLSGFSELQVEMKEYVASIGGVPLPKKVTAPKKVKQHAYTEVMSQDIAGISHTLDLIDVKSFEQIVNLLHGGKKIHIVGFRQSAPAAFWLYNNLSMLRDRVQFIQHDVDKIAHQLKQMDEESVLVVVSLNEEYKDIVAIVDMAKRRNVKIIAIRDKPLAMVTEHANVLLTISSADDGGPTCTIAVFVVLHALVECVVKQNKEQYEAYRALSEQKTQSAHLIAIG